MLKETCQIYFIKRENIIAKRNQNTDEPIR